jgi:hypothetical protein
VGSNEVQESRTTPGSTRITVSLVPKVAAELDGLADRTGLSKTDIANRAISMYAFIEEHLAQGEQIVVRSADRNYEQVVRFF